MTAVFSLNSAACAVAHSARAISQCIKASQVSKSLECIRLAAAGERLLRWRTLPRRRATKRPVVAAAITIASFLLTACGDEAQYSYTVPGSAPMPTGSADSSLVTSTRNTWNQPPEISANPPDTIRAGLTYSYAPSASDPDYDTLRYYVTGLPNWAEFNPMTGEISGRPTNADLGAHTQISIMVSDGRGGFATTRNFGIWVVASATGTATLDWYPPTLRSDGSELTDLSGYKIYWSLNPDNFVNEIAVDNPGLTSYMVSGLTPGTWYFTMTSFDSEGIESRRSSIASKTFF